MAQFFVNSSKKSGLTDSQMATWQQTVADFIAHPPEDFVIEAHYVATDKDNAYTVVTTSDRTTLDEVMSRFSPYVEAQIIEVNAAIQAAAA